MQTLKGRTALVAGGTGSLGSSIVSRLADEGCTVFATYRQPRSFVKKVEPRPSSVILMQADVTSEDQVKSVFDQIMSSSSRIDIVVNSVGGFFPGKPLADVTVTEWDSMMNVNLKSSFLITREAVRRMSGRGYGRIINISAMAGVSPRPGRIPYSISKAAVGLLTELTAAEVKGSGITINAIAPGIIDTPANRTSMPDEDPAKWSTPASIADLICYLCSPAGDSVSGTIVRLPAGV